MRYTLHYSMKARTGGREDGGGGVDIDHGGDRARGEADPKAERWGRLMALT